MGRVPREEGQVTNFNPGDRVIFFGFGFIPNTGKYAACVDVCLVAAGGSEFIEVGNEISGRIYTVHAKQCRRIKPKAKLRELWLSDSNFKKIQLHGNAGAQIIAWLGEQDFGEPGRIYREVRKAKEGK